MTQNQDLRERCSYLLILFKAKSKELFEKYSAQLAKISAKESTEFYHYLLAEYKKLVEGVAPAPASTPAPASAPAKTVAKKAPVKKKAAKKVAKKVTKKATKKPAKKVAKKAPAKKTAAKKKKRK